MWQRGEDGSFMAILLFTFRTLNAEVRERGGDKADGLLHCIFMHGCVSEPVAVWLSTALGFLIPV